MPYAQSVPIASIFHGIGIIGERDLGILHRLLVTPAYRGALVLGKAVPAGARGLAQTAILYVIAFALGVRLRLAPLPIVAVLLAVVLGRRCLPPSRSRPHAS